MDWHHNPGHVAILGPAELFINHKSVQFIYEEERVVNQRVAHAACSDETWPLTNIEITLSHVGRSAQGSADRVIKFIQGVESPPAKVVLDAATCPST